MIKPNQIFGRLFIIKKVDTLNRRVSLFLCKCSCGNSKVLRSDALRSGNTKSCGCLLAERNSCIVGKKFGKLTVISKGSIKDSNGSFRFMCLCDCGEVKEVLRGSLTRTKGATNNCGCVKNKYVKQGKSNIRILFTRYRNNAINRGITFLLSMEEFETLIKQQCHYCRTPPNLHVNISSKSKKLIYNGIDRKNNELFYRKDNSITCCFICNRAKRAMSYNDFIVWLDRIKKLGFQEYSVICGAK